MLQECRKDWIREWQHSCVFSVWNNCTKSYLGHRFRHFIGHIFATCPKHLMICHRHPGMWEGGQYVSDKNSFQQAMFLFKVSVWSSWPFGSETKYIFLVLWSSFEKCWLTILKAWGVVLLAAGVWPAPRNSSEASTGLDLQVSKWPWVMGVADYTCSWLITVITLHRQCSLLHSSTVITGPGNHTGRWPPPTSLPTSCQTLFYHPTIWSPQTTFKVFLFACFNTGALEAMIRLYPSACKFVRFSLIQTPRCHFNVVHDKCNSKQLTQCTEVIQQTI